MITFNPFQTFWMAGFECTDQLNAFGNRVDFLEITDHLQQIESDYQRLHAFNIHTVREGIRWSKVEISPYNYNWSMVHRMILAAKENNIQQIWDICHFGFPDDLTPLHPMFARRFAALCSAFIKFYRSVDPSGTLIITPINEVSFLSWLGGDVRGTSPYCIGNGWEVKYALMKAYIEGVTAIKAIDPGVLIMTTEPLVNAVAPIGATREEVEKALEIHNYQFQSVEILMGRVNPELGGRPEFVDMVGVNYYFQNQWEVGSCATLAWANEHNDYRWRPLRSLLLEVYDRFEKPIVITETSHPGEDRPQWITMIAEEVASALAIDLPILGICLYPIIDRPDWDHLTPWHNSGLWDAGLYPEENKRVLYEPYARALLQSQQIIGNPLTGQQMRVHKVA